MIYKNVQAPRAGTFFAGPGAFLLSSIISKFFVPMGLEICVDLS